MRRKAAAAGPETLESFIARAPVGLAFYDTELRLAHANAALESLPHGAIEDHLREVLLTGEPVAGVELVVAPVEPGAPPRRLRASFFPVRDETGLLVGIGATVDDVSERARTEAGLRLLSETGAALESSLRRAPRSPPPRAAPARGPPGGGPAGRGRG